MTPATFRSRMGHALRSPMVLWLTLAWVFLWGDLSIANVASGALIGITVIAVFPLPPVVFEGRVHPVAVIGLIGWFVVDLVRASIQVTALALRFGHQPRNAVIQVDLRSRSDLYLTITAELVTLVPGSVVIEVRRSTSTLYIHVLEVRDDSDVDDARAHTLAVEERVVQALASRDELAEFRRIRAAEVGRSAS
ncbi:MAG TPA: Na+/H+ antiporter subunit E [Jiangellaceae bacterium]|nr:Na+/H+ antiporter subunit E [Jiangellaceae bacterium]